MPRLVCLPGLLCEPAVFDPMLVSPKLAAVAADSHALSVPVLSDFDAIVTALSSEIPDGSVLVGMSMGSYLALALAQRLKERLAGLVLIGTNAAADTPKAAAIREKVVAWARKHGVDALADTVANAMLSPQRRDDPALRSVIATMAQAQGLDVFAAHQTALAGRADQTAALAAIDCPVLVVSGSEDTVTPPDVGRAVADAVPQGHFRLLDGVGHMPVLECPDIVADEIRQFLDAIDRPNSAEVPVQ